MSLGTTLLLGNLKITLEVWVTLIIWLVSFIFSAKNFKFFPFSVFVLSSGVFIWFYEQSFNYLYPLYSLLVSLIFMVLLFYTVDATSTTGGLT